MPDESDQIVVTLICTNRKQHAPYVVAPLTQDSGGRWLPVWVQSGTRSDEQRNWPTVASASESIRNTVTLADVPRRPTRHRRGVRREGHTFEWIARGTIPAIVEASVWILRCPQCPRRHRISRREIDQICGRVIGQGGNEVDVSYRSG